MSGEKAKARERLAVGQKYAHSGETWSSSRGVTLSNSERLP
jgi:hypothetical protein